MKPTFLGLTRAASCAALMALVTAAACAAPFSLEGGTSLQITAAALSMAQKKATQGKAAAGARTLVFRQHTVRLVAVTGPDRDMLSYRIGGLRNPTLIVTRGAILRILFANTDDDMSHDLRFGTALKTYPNKMDPLWKSSIGTPDLPQKAGSTFSAEDLLLRAPVTPGVYSYFCTVRGHAEGGMAGRIIVR